MDIKKESQVSASALATTAQMEAINAQARTQLTAEQVKAVGRVDGVLIPVGGTYTVDAAGAKAVCETLTPKWVVPMHYRHGERGFPVLLTVEDFAALWPQVSRHEGVELEIGPETAGLQILRF